MLIYVLQGLKLKSKQASIDFWKLKDIVKSANSLKVKTAKILIESLHRLPLCSVPLCLHVFEHFHSVIIQHYTLFNNPEALH